MLHQPCTSTLTIAYCSDTACHLLFRTIARQREEEPETWPRLIGTGIVDLTRGLEEGRYDAGVSLEESAGASMISVPLWHDEIAVALPKGSPLLALEEIPLDELVRHPLVLWSPASPETLAMRTNAILCEARRPLDMAQQMRTFDTLTIVVGAGFGAALAAKSRIVAAHRTGIAMRPLAGPRRVLTTWLLHRAEESSGIVQRFVERACRGQ